MSKYETVIGIEVHVNLATKTKTFCSCQNEYGATPNTNVCPVCMGLTGSIPSLNRKAVEEVIKAGLLLGCDINNMSTFERKHFFSPDQSKGYQITQLTSPLCYWGKITLDSGKDIRLSRVQLEEDSAKIIYDDKLGKSLIDYNRSGLPILEIVSRPDMSSVEEVFEFVDKLRDILVFADISRCRMELGEMRFDVNISLRSSGSKKDGARVELKNITSFKSLALAVDYEERRQSEILDSGKVVDMETRLWDEGSAKTYPMRVKEKESDYRHFPDADILTLKLTERDISILRDSIPESWEDRLKRYAKLRLGTDDISFLMSDKMIADYFDEVMSFTKQPKEIIKWIRIELLRLYRASGKSGFENIISAENLAEIIDLYINNEITRFNAKTLLEKIVESGKSAMYLLKELDIYGFASDEEITEAIDSIIEMIPHIVDDYKSSPEVINYFVGEIMRATRGRADADRAKVLIEKKLK
ncbi:MAG: Asp-tRNA(Asn)/Glu-tRNA(Gln) amidotransferase subunit GatB [Clostridia bacterium]|nr:Asp-tRNA(Asn)/Glu-tRNA(Gln) amidotransferase subunit GatB [Clostridia bacterium]